MNAFENYGLDAMGIVDANSLNQTMIRLVQEVFGKAERPEDDAAGYTILNSCLDELYAKAERITDGHCSGSRMFTTEMGNAELTQKRNILMRKLFEEISKVWHYNLEIVNGNELVSKK